MESLIGSRVLVAIAAFTAVALVVLAVALLWEGFRGLLRQRSLSRELHRISERAQQTGRRSDDAGGLLREQRSLPDWLAPVARDVPGVGAIQLLLEQARSPWSVGTFLLLTLGLGLGFGAVSAIFGFGAFASLVAVAVGALIPYLLVARRRSRRLRSFEEQFPEAIDLLARSARAGHAFQKGLQEVAEESPDPVGEEFRQVFEEQRFGLPLTESLEGLVDRVDLVDVRMFVTSVLIQKETGGNLAENLDNLGRIIRQRFIFQRQIKVHTAHGRMTGMVLGAAPIVAGLGLFVVAPDYMKTLFVEPIGQLMLVVAAALQVVGFLVIRRLTDLEF